VSVVERDFGTGKNTGARQGRESILSRLDVVQNIFADQLVWLSFFSLAG
jgi:hypothetical protein